MSLIVTQHNVVTYVRKGGGFQVENQQRSRESLLDRRTRRALWRQRKNREYYDEKGLLPPSGLTEGGRRIYAEADAAWRQQVAREAPYSRLCPPERPCHRHQRCSASRQPSENEPSRCRPLRGQHLPHLAQQTYNAGQSRGGDRSCLQPFRPCRATWYTSANGGSQKHPPQ